MYRTCPQCGSNLDPGETCDCQKATSTSKRRITIDRRSPYERAKAAAYATGNKWAIENFHATHD